MATPYSPSAPRPAWGFYESIGWALIALIVWFAVQIVVAFAMVTWQEAVEPGSSALPKMMNDGLSLAIITIVSSPTWLGVLAVATRWREWGFADYMALVPPRRRELIFSIVCLLLILAASDLGSYVLGRDIIPQFMIDAYTSSRSPVALFLLALAIIIVAPICEEIMFRGFLFRGLSGTRFGAPGAILLTAAAWSLMHVQYDWFVISQIFLLGLFFGWLRWVTGSTLLTIALHMIANLEAMIETAIKVEWLS